MGYDPGALLKHICDAVIADPDMAPAKGVTHCNQAARRVAQTMGCNDFYDINLCADDMYGIMLKGGKWKKGTGSDATIHALDGGLAFAAMPSTRLKEMHGHIAAVYPVGMQKSSSLKHDVPMVANVGKVMGIIKSSEAFPVVIGEAIYFLWS